MYFAEISFTLSPNVDVKRATENLDWLPGILIRNGQILSHEIVTVQLGSELKIFALIPERSALSPRNHNVWAKKALSNLKAVGVMRPRVRIIGRDIDLDVAPPMDPVCRCKRRKSYILFTTFLHLCSPLRCGDCFKPVPLYKIPPWRDSEYGDLLTWAANYRSCDTLYINSSAGERFGLAQLSDYDSALSKDGREICAKIEKVTAKPTFYYLMHPYARSYKVDAKRLCPACGKPWRLKKTWHKFLDFRCNRCRLLSNIAWDCR